MPREGPAMAIPFVFLLLFFFLAPSSAEIQFTRIRSDARLIISLNEFGFTNSGGLEFNITSLSLSNPNADVSKLAVFLTTRDLWLNVVRQLENSEIECSIDSNLLRNVFPLSSLREHNSSLSAVFSHPGAGWYSLAFANCVPGLRVSMDVSSAMYNLQSETGRRDYLSSDTAALPRVYSLFSLVYFAIVVYWISILYEKRRPASPIHLIVFALLILKALGFLSDAEETSVISRTGRAHLHNSRIFLKFLINMIFPQHPVVTSFARVPIDETGPKNLFLMELGFVLGEVVLFCLVLFAMKLMKLKSLRNCCAVGFCYLYFTSLVVFALNFITSYCMWMSVAAAELINLAFYAFVGYKFRHYFAPNHEVEEAVAEQLKLKPVSG